MAESEAKVNMSLDDIIKMEKKKKTNTKTKRGGSAMRGTRGGMRGSRGGMRGSMRGGSRGNMRGGSRGNMRGGMRNTRGNIRGRGNGPNRRGQWNNRYSQNNGVRGGFVNKRYNNGTIRTNLRRSRSNMSLNRMSLNNSPRGSRGGFNNRRGSKFGLTRSRSRSRTNLSSYNNQQTYMPQNNIGGGGFLKRTASMPNLRDPSSVYNRLGYQSPSQVAYRNKVKRAKNVLLQRQSKAARMQSALMLSPRAQSMTPLERKQQQMAVTRGYGAGLRSDQMMRAQKRAQYEQKLMRINASRNMSANMNFLNAMDTVYATNQRHSSLALYPTTIQNKSSVSMSPRKIPRGRSPFRQSLQNFKAAVRSASRSQSYSRQQAQQKQQQQQVQVQQRRARSRSRSRARPSRNNMTLVDAGDLEDRHFSEVMYSLSNNFGVTGRTLNDRFSLF